MHCQQIVAGAHARPALVNHLFGRGDAQQILKCLAQQLGRFELASGIDVLFIVAIYSAWNVAALWIDGFVFSAETVGAACVDKHPAAGFNVLQDIAKRGGRHGAMTQPKSATLWRALLRGDFAAGSAPSLEAAVEYSYVLVAHPAQHPP